MERSVEARAGEVTGQPPTDAAALFHGFEHYHEICVQCHGAPGMDRGELGQGIQPEPPRLDEEAEDWSDAELFWITKYGIRLAGMPAFGRTHSDDEIWGIVGFLRQMQTMTAEEYADRVRALEAETGGGEEGRQDTSPSATPTRPGRRPTSTDRGDSTVPNGSPASALQGGG
jgi:mono/diheme cytochrome c family protein